MLFIMITLFQKRETKPKIKNVYHFLLSQHSKYVSAWKYFHKYISTLVPQKLQSLI